MDLIEFDGEKYPSFVAHGNASQFSIPFAKKFIKEGYIGFDIGCGKEEWKFPGSIAIDPVLDERYHAMNLPDIEVHYIYSSHCLEHVHEPWFDVLVYWKTFLKKDGILFLYLPSYQDKYWRPWNNKKHKHILTPEHLKDAFEALNFKNIYMSGLDLARSFMIVGEK